jgi:hypothetical protein
MAYLVKASHVSGEGIIMQYIALQIDNSSHFFSMFHRYTVRINFLSNCR